MLVNCWTWHASQENEDLMQLKEGIRIKREGHNEKCLRWGDIVQIRGRRVTINNEPADGSTLVFVETRDGVQCHNLKPKPHFQNTNTWIGADGLPTLYHQGDWRDPKKKQLFRLHEGQSILFFDALKEVTKLTALSCGEQPSCVRATSGEVADYVLGEAQKRGDNPSSRAWCFYALRELGCQRQLDEFSRLFPNFHRK